MEGFELRIDGATRASVAFLEAASTGHETGARSACTEDGWSAGDDPVRGLFMGISRKGLVADVMGPPRVFAHRAAQLVVLSHPASPRPLGDVWLLLESDRGIWRIVGASKLRNVVGLFLWNRVPGHLSWKTLPPSDRIDEWAAPVTASLHLGDMPDFGQSEFQTRLAVEDVIITPLDPVELAAAQRAAAGWRFTTPSDRIGYDVWIILDLSVSPPEPLRALEFPGLETLLDGLDLAWPHEDPDEPGRALTPEERPTDPAGAAAILESLLLRSMENAGVDKDDDSPAAEQARKMLSYIHRMVPAGAPAPQPDTAARNLVLPPALQSAIGESVQRLVDEGVAAPGELRVDKEFVENHGGALVGGLFAAVLGDALPPAVELTVPVEGADPDGPQVVKLTAEPKKLLHDLITGDE